MNHLQRQIIIALVFKNVYTFEKRLLAVIAATLRAGPHRLNYPEMFVKIRDLEGL